MLQHKWTWVKDAWVGETRQVVIPVKYREAVGLRKLSHNEVAGHLGIKKSYDRILHRFFWPGKKKDVTR